MTPNKMDSAKDFFAKSSEQTKTALRELNEQMKTFDYKSAIKRGTPWEDSLEEDDIDFELSSKKSKKEKVAVVSSDAMLVNKIRKLESAVDRLSVELDSTDILLYNTKLELSNKSIELEDERIRTTTLTKTIKELEHKNFIYTLHEALMLFLFIFYVYYFW
jgi:hypothetical protein